MDERLKQLVMWITTNAQMESRFLTPNPGAYVDCDGLVTKISELFDIPTETLAAWSEEAP